MNATAFVSLSEDRDISNTLKSFKALKYFNGIDLQAKRSRKDFIIILSIDDASMLEAIKKDPEIRKRIKGLLIKEDIDSKNIFSSLFESLKLSTFLNRAIDYSSEAELRRVVRAWNLGAQKDLISSFEVITESQLYIKTCAFEKFFVPVKKLKSLSSLSKDQLHKFELDEDGSYVYWPDFDIHLDLQNFREAISTAEKEKSKIKNLKYDKLYGKAMKLIREDLEKNQSELGLSDKQIRRYESGLARPSLSGLKTIAENLGLELSIYLDRVANAYQKLKG